ncbi:CBM35 domain-containing protein [Radiobacillus sp. PE A8.2]|uniref:CBM35 domain-containing protein n=1 Tax=Radiobacillus sp. PE A8.2 TaxID=3380349 RepID=UPI0038904ED5
MKKLFSSVLAIVMVLSFATVAFADTTYQAEDANLVGATKSDAAETASGGEYVLGFDDPSSDAVEFTVTVSEAKSYEVELGYATAMDNASVSVNGNVVTTPSTGGWADNGFGTTTMTLDLEEGENTITFKQSTDYVQLDYIKVLSDGNGPENPQTGDEGTALYMVFAAVALVGGIVLVASRKKILK